MMGFSFECELRKAEKTINTLIEACKLNGGSVYIANADNAGFAERLDKPICISYFMPMEHVQEVE